MRTGIAGVVEKRAAIRAPCIAAGFALSAIELGFDVMASLTRLIVAPLRFLHFLYRLTQNKSRVSSLNRSGLFDDVYCFFRTGGQIIRPI